jgi:hypothetical protein
MIHGQRVARLVQQVRERRVALAKAAVEAGGRQAEATRHPLQRRLTARQGLAQLPLHAPDEVVGVGRGTRPAGHARIEAMTTVHGIGTHRLSYAGAPRTSLALASSLQN